MITRRVLRDEKKYIINRAGYEILKSRLLAALEKDGHGRADGSYFIRSLYFDDYSKSGFNDKLSGISDRCKYRMRYYNFDKSYIAYEKKEKHGDKCEKSSVIISRDEAFLMANGESEAFIDSDNMLLKEHYALWRYRRLRPAVIVDYERFAFSYPAFDVRITLDSNLRSGGYSTDLFNEDLATFPVLDEGESILEVKYNSYLAPHIAMLIDDVPKVLSANSKYCRCIEMTV